MTGARKALRVLITRGEEDCAAWAAELERRGIAGVALPCISAEPIDEPGLRTRVRETAERADWLVFTSKRGVEAYARLMSGGQVGAKIAAVGQATAEVALRRLGRVDLVGPGTAQALAERLIEELGREEVVLLALAENARDTLEDTLRAAGLDCRRFDVYRTVPSAPQAAKQSLASLDVDAVLLASPSAARGLLNQVRLDDTARLVTIGPSTSRAVRALGLGVAAEAREQSLSGLLEALENTYV
jgi:uroporphyrinogen-III synthase